MKRSYFALGMALVVAAVSLYRITAVGDDFTPVGELSIAPFFHDARAAVSYTFDDGLQSHVDVAAPLLEKFGFQGTFYIVPGRMREKISDAPEVDPRFRFGECAISWEEALRLKQAGHEIGNHSLTHDFMNRMHSEAELRAATADASLLIRDHLGEPPMTFAYPYNEWHEQAHHAALACHIAVREKWNGWGSLGKAPFGAEQANEQVREAMGKGAWLVPMIHGIDGGFMPLKSKELATHLQWMHEQCKNSGSVWVATYADVYRYRTERSSSRIERLEADESSLRFVVRCELDAEVFTVPLTVIVPLPMDQATDELEVRRGGRVQPFVRQRDRVLIDVVPGEEAVEVRWQ